MYKKLLRLSVLFLLATVLASNTVFADIPINLYARSMVDNNITGNVPIMTPSQDNDQNHTIHGRVTNSNGEPLVGVTIIVENENNNTVTDKNGQFIIQNVSDSAELEFSFVGFLTQKVTVNGRNQIDVILLQNNEKLNEVIVTGYSTQKKKDITGSIAVVDMNAMKSIPTGSAVQALQGQASGLSIIRTGQAGAPSTIRIRGIGSFGNSNPLVLVDGVEADLETINPESIASVQVLKDASAAIYGVRGANGVILVTTKNGKLGSPVVTYNAYSSVQLPLPGNPFNLLNNSTEYARLFMIAYPGSALFPNGVLPDYLYGGPGVKGTGMEGDSAVNPDLYLLDPTNPSNNYLIEKVNKSGTDWFHEIFKPALQQQHNLSVSGATEKANYLFSLNYLDEQNTLIETYLKRYSLRINTGYKIGKNIRIGENAYLFTSENPQIGNIQEGNPIGYVFEQMPIVPVYDIKGNFGGDFEGPDLGRALNPVAMLKRTSNNINRSWNALGNVYLDVDFLRHFTARTSYGANVNNVYNRNFTFNDYNDREGFTNPTSLSESRSNSLYWIWTNTLTYNNTFGKHSLKILAGSEAIESSSRGLNGSRDNFFSTDPNYLILNNGTGNIQNSSSASDNSLYSLFSRIDYSYSDKYLLGLTVRRDGSSLFGSNNRFGTFPSVSVGWRISQENFMKNILWLEDLKIRGSYGILGSQNNLSAGNAFTSYSSSIGGSYYDIAGTNNSSQPGFYQSQTGNPSTKWEKDIISNVGLDATLLNDKIDISIDYYVKSINGLLFPQPLPATAGGAGAPTVNIGDIKNTGLDISANYRDRINKDLNFTIGASITTYNNKIVKVPDPGYFDTYGSRFGDLIRNQQGGFVSSFFGYKVIGIFQSDADVAKSPKQPDAAPGRFKYKDVNGDGQITPDDRTSIGNPNPNFTYGLNLAFKYRKFDFSAILYGSQGNDIFNETKWYTYFYSAFKGARSNDMLNAWTPENTNTQVPKIEAAGSFSTSAVANSFYVENGSFLKLRSLVFGYSISSNFLDRIKINSLRIYVQGSNLFTVTKYTGLDPEVQASGGDASFGVDLGTYPSNERNFLFGVNLSF